LSLLRNPQVLLLLLAIILLALTFTRPTLELERPTYRYVFVFDISQSMNVMDVPNTDASISRLDFAKKMTLDAISELPCGTEAGLALFTGHRAFLLITPIEVCSNHREFSSIINNINWKMTWKARSEIAKGLYKSISLLKLLSEEKEDHNDKDEPDPARLVFITDGHEAPPINPEAPPRFAGKTGDIKGLVVGVGDTKPVPIPKFDKEGKQNGFWKVDEVQHTDFNTQVKQQQEGIKATSGTEHLSSLKEAYLKGLSEKTGLKYHRLDNAKALSDQMKSKSLSNSKTITTDMRWFFALCGLLAFVSTLLIAPVKKYLHLLSLK